MPRCGRDQHLVASDVLDAPTGSAQGKHIAHSGLINHLLIQLAHPARSTTGALARTGIEEYAKHAPIRNRATAGHGHALGARPRGHHSRHAVIDHTGFKFRKVCGRIHTAYQVQHGVIDFPRQIAVGPGPADHLVPLIGIEPVLAGRGHGRHCLLRQHVQRVARGMHFLNESGAHARDRQCGLHQIRTVLGIKGAMRYRAHKVPSAAHALQAGGHRGRRFHLHHQFHGTHIDAQLQRARGHHGLERALLQHGLCHRALILRHRAMVGAGDNRRGLAGDVDLLHQLGRVAAGFGRQRIRIMLLRIELIEPAGQPLGRAARVDKYQRGAMRHDLRIEVILNKRPDRLRRGQRGLIHGRRADANRIIDRHLPNGGALLWCGQIGHILHRHVHVQLPLLLRIRGHNFYWAVAT